MFKFIESENDKANVTDEYVDSIERSLDIKFPDILRKYYLNHNGAQIKECTFELYDTEFSVHSICDLNYGTMPVEKILEYNSKNEDIPNECYPIAEDDINYYYWNTKDGKVYYYMEDEEEPILISDSIEEFFEILNSCCNGIVKIQRNEKYEQNPYLNLINHENIEDKKEIDAEKVLKYNGKFIRNCNLILFILVIISLLSIGISDGLSIIFVGVFAIWFLVFSIIDIINRIITNKALKKYDMNEIKRELKSDNVIKLKGIDTYLTDNYIISNSKTLKITKYEEIAWIYVAKPMGTVEQKATMSVAYNIGGTPVVGYLKNGKYVNIASVKNNAHLNVIFAQIKERNQDVLIGNSLENMQKYGEVNYKYKNKLDINNIIAYLVFILLIVALIYKIFFR